MLSETTRDLLYLLAAALFIFDLKWMSHPRKAVAGNYLGVIGMAIAIGATLLGEPLSWAYIGIGALVGTVIGIVVALRVKMTAMPEMVGLLNGFGGGASVLVAGAAALSAFEVLQAGGADADMQTKIATAASALIGSVTFFGSYVAYGKLAEFLAVKWKLHTWQKVIKFGFSGLTVAGGAAYAAYAGFVAPADRPHQALWALLVVAACAAIGGILLSKSGRFVGMDALKWFCAAASIGLCVMVVLDPGDLLLLWLLVAVSGVLGVTLVDADRRCRHAGGHRPAELLLRPGRGGHRLRARQLGADHRRLAGRRVGRHPDADHVQGDEPLAGQRAVRRARGRPRDSATARRGLRRQGQVDLARGSGHAARRRPARGDRARLRHGGRPGAARRPRPDATLLESAGIDGRVRHPSGRRPHARPHERAAGRGRHPLRASSRRWTRSTRLSPRPTWRSSSAPTTWSTRWHAPIRRARSPACRSSTSTRRAPWSSIKRSLSPGFAGIPNPLFAADNTLMFFGDGKKAILEIIHAVKEGS